MTIDIDKLNRFRIPEGRQDLTPEGIAAYALSIGMGRLPPDAVPLDYVDPLRGPVVMPAMVLVMAHPGFWAADPASGIDPNSVLHMTQSFAITGQLPTTGRVTSRSEIIGAIDKGPGKAAIVTTGTDLFDAEGDGFARLERQMYVRNGGGFGGENRSDANVTESPSEPPDRVCDLTTGDDQALFYRLNGDLNPLHSDPSVAARAGFERPILHGLCVMGLVAHALLKEQADYRAEDLRSMTLRFSKPVFPGETIRTEMWDDGRFRARVLERDTIVVDRGRAGIGQRAMTLAGAG